MNTTATDGTFDVEATVDQVVALLVKQRDEAVAATKEAQAEKTKIQGLLVEAQAKLAANDKAAPAQGATANADQVKALETERDAAKSTIETLTSQLRAAEEKAAKSAVKASMADKYKKDLTELKSKVSSGQLVAGPAAGANTTAGASSPAAPASPAPMSLSIKGGGGSAATAAASSGSPASQSTDATATSTTPAASTTTRGAKAGTARGAARTARGRGRSTLQSVLAGKSCRLSGRCYR